MTSGFAVQAKPLNLAAKIARSAKSKSPNKQMDAAG